MPTAATPDPPVSPKATDVSIRAALTFARITQEAEDKVWMTACVAGSVPAFESLYGRHGARCLGLARSMLRDPASAEAAVQDAFLDAWRGAGQYNPQRSAVAPWLFLLTHSRAVDRVRRGRGEPRLTEDRADVGGDLAVAEARVYLLLGERTKALLSKLPDEQRRCLVLAHWGGHTVQQISDLTNAPVAIVMSRCRSGLIRLTKALIDEGLQDPATDPRCA